MAVLSIHPIHTQSLQGYSVLINGLAPTDHDCIVGEITLPNGLKQAQWNLSGIMRGGSDACNLRMKSDDLEELVGLARKLGVA